MNIRNAKNRNFLVNKFIDQNICKMNNNVMRLILKKLVESNKHKRFVPLQFMVKLEYTNNINNNNNKNNNRNIGLSLF